VLCVVLRLVTNDTLFLRLGIPFCYMFDICIFFSRKLQEICVRSYRLGTLFCVSTFSMFVVSEHSYIWSLFNDWMSILKKRYLFVCYVVTSMLFHVLET
jgi:hypothetical protein